MRGDSLLSRLEHLVTFTTFTLPLVEKEERKGSQDGTKLPNRSLLILFKDDNALEYLADTGPELVGPLQVSIE
jgi:hypothetical protein